MLTPAQTTGLDVVARHNGSGVAGRVTAEPGGHWPATVAEEVVHELCARRLVRTSSRSPALMLTADGEHIHQIAAWVRWGIPAGTDLTVIWDHLTTLWHAHQRGSREGTG